MKAIIGAAAMGAAILSQSAHAQTVEINFAGTSNLGSYATTRVQDASGYYNQRVRSPAVYTDVYSGTLLLDFSQLSYNYNNNPNGVNAYLSGTGTFITGSINSTGALSPGLFGTSTNSIFLLADPQPDRGSIDPGFLNISATLYDRSTYITNADGTRTSNLDYLYFTIAASSFSTVASGPVVRLPGSDATYIYEISRELGSRTYDISGNAIADSVVTTSSSGALTTIGFTQAVGGVPEPATWALMVLGFGGVGCALRRRPRTAALRHAA